VTFAPDSAQLTVQAGRRVVADGRPSDDGTDRTPAIVQFGLGEHCHVTAALREHRTITPGHLADIEP
jgi:hypothetical protein